MPLSLGRWDLDSLAVVFLLLIVLCQLVVRDHGGGADAKRRFQSYSFCLSVIALAVVMGAGFVLGRSHKPVSALRWLGAISIVSTFIFTSLSVQHPVVWSLRLIGADAGLFSTRVSTWLGIAVLGILLAAGGRAVVPNPTGPTGESFLPWFRSLPRVEIPLPEAPASVTLVKVIDYQCPPCKSLEEYYGPVIARLVGQGLSGIRVETLNYPLDSECNRFVSQTLHPAACEAAVVMTLAKARGTATAMAGWLWANQGTLSAESVISAGESIAGIDSTKGSYEAALARVRRDIETVHSMNVDRTPAFFVNGVSLGLIPRKYLEIAIRDELERAQNAARHE